ncbi:unnamed protein product [Caenorhabditis brenneri]
MKDNNLEVFLKRIQINDKETSLSEFIENAWDRKLNLQFESSFAPVYVLCHDKNTNTLNRRGGAVLEVVAKNRRTDRLERNRWIAVFRYEPKAGYYLEYLKDLEAIQLEGEEEETTLDQEEVFMNSTYICPFKKEMNSVINRNLEGMKQTREELISRKIIREWKRDEYDF